MTEEETEGQSGSVTHPTGRPQKQQIKDLNPDL